MRISELERNGIKKDDAIVVGAKPKTQPEPWKVQGFDVYISQRGSNIDIGVFDGNKKIMRAQMIKTHGNVEYDWTPLQGCSMSYIRVAPDYQGRQLGLELYVTLILKLHWPIYSVESQSPGARKTWIKMFQNPKISVYVLNAEDHSCEIPVVSGQELNLPSVDIYNHGHYSLIAVSSGTPDDNTLKMLIKK